MYRSRSYAFCQPGRTAKYWDLSNGSLLQTLPNPENDKEGILSIVWDSSGLAVQEWISIGQKLYDITQGEIPVEFEGQIHCIDPYEGQGFD
jgi:ferritin-like protein